MTNEHWTRKRQILNFLSHRQFVSGEQIATELGLSRAAINQHIESMSDYGIDIYSVKGKGYQLAAPVSVIDEQKLLAKIDKRCFYFNEIDSTNSFMLAHVDDLSSGDICIAEYQSQGRGRRGRQWQSPYGHHLYASLFWRTTLLPQQLMGLSLVVGCAIEQVLRQMGVNDLGLKWPNDIYLDGRKLAGILIELEQSQTEQTNVVIGFGININMPSQQAELIDQPWSDLSHCNKALDKTALIVNLHKQLLKDLAEFELNGLVSFVSRWEQADLFTGKEVTLQMLPNEVHGTYNGIDTQGGIVLTTADGEQSFIGGEISLRKRG